MEYFDAEHVDQEPAHGRADEWMDDEGHVAAAAKQQFRERAEELNETMRDRISRGSW